MDGLLLIGAAAAGVAAWKSGIGELVSDRAGDFLGRWGIYLTHDSGAYSDLPERLAYRDFLGDVVETRDGWMWGCLELRPISSDGYSTEDWNALGERVNRVLTTLEDRTWVQVMLRADMSAEDGVSVFSRLAESCNDYSLKALVKARAKHLEREALAGRITRHRLCAFIGRQRRPIAQKVPFKSLFTSSAWADLEYDDFLQLREETIRARNSFMNAYAAVGGWARPVDARMAFEIAYEKLNPERARRHPAPAYTMQSFARQLVQQAAPPQGAGRADDISPELLLAELDGPKRKVRRRAPLKKSAGSETLFADSPRESLCMTPLEVCGDHFIIGGRPSMTISMHRLPVKTFAGLMEALTKQAGLDFAFDVSTTFEIGNQTEWDERFERMLRRARINIQRSNNPNQDEELKRDQVYNLRNEVKKGEEKIGNLGLTISFSADTVEQLRARRDLIFVVLRQMDGMEGVVEQSVPLDQFFATLPCTPHTDFRKRPVLSHNATGLMALTGSTTGVAEDEATDVLQRADGGLFFWNPRSRLFNSGMSLYCGSTGSGKSGALNRQRTVLLATGHRGVTLDFGGSAFRVCEAVGGEYIDITDARRTRGLGLFDIRPRSDEQYLPEELNEQGLPLDRLAQVEMMLEMLCLDPTRPKELALEPRLASYLREAIALTYGNLVDETPTIDDFIRTLKRAPKGHKEKGEELAARLTIYATHGSLGRFLNDRSEPISVENPYTVFDFRGALDDPRLMLVASMAVISHIGRLLRVGRHITKFIDVDEFNVVSKNRLICRAIDQSMRTARKLNALCSVASQDPADFDESDEARGIRGNCEVYWLFNLPRPDYAGKIFELAPGIVKLLGRLQAIASNDYRDCVLIYPGGGCAHLRLRNGPLDSRLLLGAGREVATFDQALEDIEGPVYQRLVEALSVDGLGTDVPTDKTAALF